MQYQGLHGALTDPLVPLEWVSNGDSPRRIKGRILTTNGPIRCRLTPMLSVHLLKCEPHHTYRDSRTVNFRIEKVSC